MTDLEEKLTKENAKLSQEMNVLREQLEWFKREVFGSKKESLSKLGTPADSSSVIPGFESLFEGMEEQEEEKTETKTVKKSKKKRDPFNHWDFPANAKREVIRKELSPKERVCPTTGLPLIEFGVDVQEQLVRVSAHYKVIETHWVKYSIPNKPKLGVYTAQKLEQPIPGSRADVTLLAFVLLCKYADHLPLYRIEEMFKREGLKIPRQTLSKWVIKLGQLLDPLGELLKEQILESKRIFTDDSPLSLQVKGKGKLQTARIWTYVGGDADDPDPPLIYYEFTESRQHKYPEEMLKDFKGIFHADAYKAYVNIAQNEGVQWQACLVHARRKFFNVMSPNEACREIINSFDQIFDEEKESWKLSEDERLVIRQSKTKIRFEELVQKVKSYRDKHPMIPKGNFKEAIDYFLNYEENFKVFLDKPNVRAENNVAERSIRQLAIGRKNWLFVGSLVAGKSAATIMSLIQTCRKLGHNPEEYLVDVLAKIPNLHKDHFHTLLPQNWKKD